MQLKSYMHKGGIGGIFTPPPPQQASKIFRKITSEIFIPGHENFENFRKLHVYKSASMIWLPRPPRFPIHVHVWLQSSLPCGLQV